MSNNTLNQRPVLRRLLGYFVPHKKLLLIALLSIISFSLVDAGMVYFVQPLIDDGLAKADGAVLKTGALIVILIFLLRGLTSFCANYSLAYVSQKITCCIRQQVFEHMQYLPLTYVQQQSTGKLISKLTYDTEQLSRATAEAFMLCLRESLIVLVLLGIMFNASWQLSLIFLILGPLIAMVIRLVSRRFKQVSFRLQENMGEISRHCEQSINNHREILAFSTQKQEVKRFFKINNFNRQQSMKLATASAISNPVVQLIASLAIAGVLWLASIDGVIQQLSAGTFTTTLVAMGSLLRPLKQLTSVNQTLQRGLTAAHSIFQLLDEGREPETGTLNCPGFRRCLHIQDLNFAYADNPRHVLKNINLQLKKGQTLALVGDSGSGKTSLLNVLLRFHPLPNKQPCIRLDGVDINAFSLDSLRQQFSLVSQQVVLFDDSIAANIAYGCMEHVSREQIEAAAKAAHVWEFAQLMPQGLDSQVGENGSQLSGGQKQRVAIARAILRNAPILLLDEATSALDSKSEAKIQQALQQLQQDKTSIVITHRLSTIYHADVILVLRQGQVCESGNHQQLMQQQGYYYQLYQQQYQQQDSQP